MKQIKYLSGLTITAILLLWQLTALAAALPKSAPYPGGIEVVKLNIESKTEPHAYYVKQRAMVINHNGRWFAIIGIPLKAKAGKHRLLLKSANAKHYVYFNVVDKEYPLRHITITDKSKVTPPPKLRRKIAKQTKLFRKILATYTPTSKVYFDFKLPVKGRFSSGFGIRRIYNKVKPGRHTGLDIAAAKGTPIKAAADGKILATEDFVLTGNTVFVDHGQGLITYYCHMSSVDVKPGQWVTQGQLLGKVGSTGRVTGPHLHWGVTLNKTKVNPLLFVVKKQKKSE